MTPFARRLPVSTQRGLLAFALLSLLLAACAAAIQGSTTPAPTTTFTAAETSQPTATSIPPTPTPSGPLTLRVWWPDALTLPSSDSAALLLDEQFSDFQSAASDVRVEVRLKKADSFGGIFETLRSGSAVAPDSLPDVTLLRRDELIEAVRLGLIQPIQGQIASAILGSLVPTALELGRFDGVLYGLTYAVDVRLIAYRPVTLTGSFATFEAVLADRQPFVFPAGITQGISDVLLVQYLSAGGRISDLLDGRPKAEPLRIVFNFYAQAATEGIITPAVLDYAESSAYLPNLSGGSLDAAVVTSRQYLDLRSGSISLDPAPIPLAAGDPSSTLDGWMWVIVTRDPDRQVEAARLIEWMMEIDRQGVYTEQIHWLPSRQAALAAWEQTPFTALAAALMNNAVIAPAEDSAPATFRALQNALAAVISGQQTADQAVADVLAQLAPSAPG
ncbi:MAG: extracellular solute-binding protein [Anaerolineae bacterium]|nr:extracellular solute-binding protein [Anaerolineae bacterium]